MRFTMSYNNGEETLVFPVLPNGSVNLSRDQNNVKTEGLTGEMQTIGTLGLASFEITSFFPMRSYPWAETGSVTDGWRYVDAIERVRQRRIPFRGILQDNSGRTIFNLPFAVDSFEYGVDQAGDIAYSMSCTEYRFADATNDSTNAQAAAETTEDRKPVKTESQAQEEQSLGYTPLYSDSDALMMARVMFCEARGIESKTEIACVGWTILNRVDAGYGSIYNVITAANQFAYRADAGTVSDYGYDLVSLATDVLIRWSKEHSGQTGVGRVLPAGYMWFTGDGSHNYFRNKFSGGTRWDYSLPSPYDTVQNLLPADYYNSSGTVRGVTFTVNANHSVTVTGEASGGNANFMLAYDSSMPGPWNLTLPAGRYILSGCPDGGSSTTYRIRLATAGGSTVIIANYSGETPFEISDALANTQLRCYIQILSGYEIEDELVFIPQIRMAVD